MTKRKRKFDYFNGQNPLIKNVCKKRGDDRKSGKSLLKKLEVNEMIRMFS